MLAGHEHRVELGRLVPHEAGPTRHLALNLHFGQGRNAMVAGHYHQHVAHPHRCIQVLEELAEHDVGLDGHLFDLRRVRPLGMAHIIVGRKTDGQHVGGIALTQLLGLYGALGEVFDQFVAERAGFQSGV